MSTLRASREQRDNSRKPFVDCKIEHAHQQRLDVVHTKIDQLVKNSDDRRDQRNKCAECLSGSCTKGFGDEALDSGQSLRGECFLDRPGYILHHTYKSVEDGNALFAERVLNDAANIVEVVTQQTHQRNNRTNSKDERCGGAEHSEEHFAHCKKWRNRTFCDASDIQTAFSKYRT